jgi:hypothetical protein
MIHTTRVNSFCISRQLDEEGEEETAMEPHIMSIQAAGHYTCYDNKLLVKKLIRIFSLIGI